MSGFFAPIDVCLSGFPLNRVDFGPHSIGFGRQRFGSQWAFSFFLLFFSHSVRAVGGGVQVAGEVPLDPPGPGNKVTFSAQQRGCLALGSRAVWGQQPSSAAYSDHIVMRSSQEGPGRSSLGFGDPG